MALVKSWIGSVHRKKPLVNIFSHCRVTSSVSKSQSRLNQHDRISWTLCSAQSPANPVKSGWCRPSTCERSRAATGLNPVAIERLAPRMLIYEVPTHRRKFYCFRRKLGASALDYSLEAMSTPWKGLGTSEGFRSGGRFFIISVFS